MKPSLQVRLSQHLALTPQLQQSIRLLQLSTLELHQEVGQMLDQNPFLEMEEDAPATPFETPLERQAADRPADNAAEADTPAAAETSDTATELRADEFGTTEREDWENGTEGDDFDGIRETPSGAAATGEGGDSDMEERRSSVGSLQDHLRSQLVGMRLSPEDHAAIEVLIESLDGDGYLADPLPEIAERLAEMFGVDSAEGREGLDERLACALKWLQSLDPLGVGARSLSECLALQLKATRRCPARQVALRISEQYLDLLARRDFKRLAVLTGCDEDTVRLAQELIRACEPKPGRPFSLAVSNIVIPDVVVKKTGRGLSVQLNPDVMLRVSKAIVERQKAFFTHGAIAMKPLVLREIADELGLHESTISRVTTAKYMATPQGTFELKYFFGSSLNTEAGGNASSTAVRALIQQFVSAENGLKPLSDSQLSTMLEEQGIQVARRTVAKYREALRIAPAGQRKSP
jgi:RNA polymerase sigma-54 factor